ncbi:hypothetical protein [Mesorhizobium sp. B1-1-5]|uniref:hypothetical protein n=1 Tax=Mesorhizobium sp. B1-1-5 TaxID=2589979 RepID=UPI001129ECE5|nr:hypothetical protein [Mesorhizobium sp. B1-1-5]TPN92824.1 hypothetical protein FJ980_27345 [Mesorhizobium sp. B1-1-5]
MKRPISQSEERPSPPFKIRATSPGRLWGIKEWTPEELRVILVSYSERFPEEWVAYLGSENDNGFISNAMNAHICSFIEGLFPGFHPKQYRAGAVDFRFANDSSFHFRLWQPENRYQRRKKWLAQIKTGSRSRNGGCEWTDEQTETFLEYMEKTCPDIWSAYRDSYNEVGFLGVGTIQAVKTHVAEVFSLPEDCDCGTIMFGLRELANRRYEFEMLKPENNKKRDVLENEWFNNWRGRITFDEWREQLRRRSIDN